MTLYPKNATYRYELSLMYLENGETKNAQIQLLKAIVLIPQIILHPEIKSWGENNKEAIFKALLSENNNISRPHLYARIGYLAYYFNEEKLAVEYLEKALSLQSTFSTPYYLLYKIGSGEGKHVKANELLAKFNILTNYSYENFVKNENSLPNIEMFSYNTLLGEYRLKFKKWYRCQFILDKNDIKSF